MGRHKVELLRDLPLVWGANKLRPAGPKEPCRWGSERRGIKTSDTPGAYRRLTRSGRGVRLSPVSTNLSHEGRRGHPAAFVCHIVNDLSLACIGPPCAHGLWPQPPRGSWRGRL